MDAEIKFSGSLLLYLIFLDFSDNSPTNPMRKLIYVVLGLISSSALIASCSEGNDKNSDNEALTYSVNENFDAALSLIDSMMTSDAGTNQWTFSTQWNTNEGQYLETHAPDGDWEQILWDPNVSHFRSAKTGGIVPINSDTFNLVTRMPVERVTATKYYFIDKLTHSFPYLIPESHQLLDEIGKRFHEALAQRGGGNYRLKVTSMLRTATTVSNLRKVNDASVDSSSHLYGTSFDISFNNFGYDGGEPTRKQEDLKKLLAEVIFGLQQEGRCYTIYEAEPGCFHTTLRPSIPKSWLRN